MMGKWAFVSDFDGTITNKDFYWEIIEQCYPEGTLLYERWKANEIKDIDFLTQVFQSVNMEEDVLIRMIHSMEIDSYVPEFIHQVQQNEGDFYILSAGTDYYINHFLQQHHIKNVDVFSNQGYFHDNNIHLKIDPSIPFYSKKYGIDKAKVIQSLKQWYDVIYFIGDSEPDVHAARHADVTFAKDALQSMLREKEMPFYPVESFKQVREYVKEMKQDVAWDKMG